MLFLIFFPSHFSCVLINSLVWVQNINNAKKRAEHFNIKRCWFTDLFYRKRHVYRQLLFRNPLKDFQHGVHLQGWQSILCNEGHRSVPPTSHPSLLLHSEMHSCRIHSITILQHI